MANELVVVKESPLRAVDIRKQVNLIQEVMKAVMKEGEHFGKIPGCDKPSLFKPGAEKLIMTFRLAADYEELPGSIERDDFICYKIKCNLIHIPTGQTVGNGFGACNSKEKKYKTRAVYLNKATEEEKSIGKKEKRIGKDQKSYEVLIVPQDPWDVQNTLYKMACKRALIAATLNATAASDLFTQDIEDVEDIEDLSGPQGPNKKPSVDIPQEKEKVRKPIEPVLSVNGAVEQPEGVVFNVEGILANRKTETVTKKDKTRGDITHYTISSDDGSVWMTISKWGKAHEGVDVGIRVRFSQVKVSAYKDELKYLAQEVLVVTKGEGNKE